MYMELTKKQTYDMLEDLLISSIPKFEFPRKNLFDYEKGFSLPEDDEEEEGEEKEEGYVFTGYFNCALTSEEINILATYMIVEWIGQQLASVENTRMKYSGTDFKFTSQANHMAKLMELVKQEKAEMMHLQRLYKRRVVKDGKIQTTMKNLMSGE